MNHIGILKKVSQELAQETPKLDYIRGMIVTLIEVQEETKATNSGEYLVSDGNGKTRVTTLDKEIASAKELSEAEILDAQAKASLAKIKELADQSTETT